MKKNLIRLAIIISSYLVITSYMYNKSVKEITYNYHFKAKPHTVGIKKEEYLSIPSINLKEPIYNDRRNNIDIGLEKLYDGENKTVIVGHSGYGPLAKFKHLDKVKINDLAYLSTNDKLTAYKLNKVLKLKKTEEFKVNVKAHNKLWLITCSQFDKKYFLIFEFNTL